MCRELLVLLPGRNGCLFEKRREESAGSEKWNGKKGLWDDVASLAPLVGAKEEQHGLTSMAKAKFFWCGGDSFSFEQRSNSRRRYQE
ncbi:hypothetical protein EI42_06452 [Thermosporothrix hazakensis]|jgi:hypothetical protein|uniref:Uncharacterized protein n=1 Tax=Thermosporothrix hazakensis TaxID=644383 RepID=A0A326TMX3_THEHA|nr:hypothetical protein EI42_06452 [Thermosporothrix hazakensis]